MKSNLVDRKLYPFGKDRIVIKFPETAKIGLTESEVKKIIDLSLDPATFAYHARNIWMFSFYLAGMRVSDVLRLQWNNIIDGRLYYTMGKNDKAGSLKLPEKALEILKNYEGHSYINNLIFPDLTNVKNFADAFDVQRK